MDEAPRGRPLLIVAAALVLAAGVVLFLVLGRDNHAPATDTPASRPVAVRPDAGESRPVVTVVKRPADRPPPEEAAPPVAARADGRVLPKELVAELGAPVKTAIRECASTIPEEHRVGSRMKGILKVAVVGGTAKIDTADLSLTGVPDGDAATATLACLQKHVIGTSAGTAEADVSDYEISVSLLLFPGATGVARPPVSTGSIQ